MKKITHLTFDKDFNLKESGAINRIKKPSKDFRFVNYMNIGYYLITPILFGLVVGLWLDKLLKTKGIFFIICFSFGCISSFYNLRKIYIDERKNH